MSMENLLKAMNLDTKAAVWRIKISVKNVLNCLQKTRNLEREWSVRMEGWIRKMEMLYYKMIFNGMSFEKGVFPEET